jgi:hypothetical protein
LLCHFLSDLVFTVFHLSHSLSHSAHESIPESRCESIHDLPLVILHLLFSFHHFARESIPESIPELICQSICISSSISQQSAICHSPFAICLSHSSASPFENLCTICNWPLAANPLANSGLVSPLGNQPEHKTDQTMTSVFFDRREEADEASEQSNEASYQKFNSGYEQGQQKDE